MQILQSDWPRSYTISIYVRWLGVVYTMPTSSRFSEVSKQNLEILLDMDTDYTRNETETTCGRKTVLNLKPSHMIVVKAIDGYSNSFAQFTSLLTEHFDLK